MRDLYRLVATADHPAARLARRSYRAITGFSLPTPRILVRPMLWAFLALRQVYYWLVRVLICEPLFKAYCRSYGRGVRTGVYVHWVQGKGAIHIGDHVTVDGKCGFSFARRAATEPVISIGSGTWVGHGCSFTAAERITIGEHCLLAVGVRILDSPGHPLDPAKRRAGQPPEPHEIKPVQIGNNVWIGAEAVIFPGVTIGDNSVVGTRSVVTRDVPPNTVVAGIPAKVVGELTAPSA